MRWTLGEIAAATGAQLVGGSPAIVVDDVTVDSRLARPGSLFVALRGERLDGHDFAESALQGGASAVLVRKGAALVEPRLEVPDTLAALMELAWAGRERIDVPVAAVTGSTGKTSTKDLLAAALGPATWAAPRSFNNEVGVPLTVLGTPEDAESVVLEVGSRGPGHIARLAPALQPAVAVIVNVGLAHIETFGSPEAVSEAKWELVDALGPDGVAVLPTGEPLLDRPLPAGVVRFTFGEDRVADVRVEDVEVDVLGRPAFRLRTPEGAGELRLGLAGRHQAVNASAATAAALALGRGLDEIVEGLEKAKGSPWRMEVTPGPVTVVNDAYNANPASTESALRTVAGMPGRRVAVLGEMAELGPVSEKAHRQIGSLADQLGFLLVVVGDAPGLADGYGRTTRSAADAEAALSLLRTELREGDVVLIKASRVVGLERLAEALVRDWERTR